MTRLSVPKDRLRVVLLEGIHETARVTFAAAGYTSVELVTGSPDRETLKRLLADAHVVGIRSRTILDRALLEAAERLFCIGCFCIGTDQVDLAAARQRGVPVFNAPYSNTRSVAELVIGEIIMLLRRIPEKSAMAHAGTWRKSVDGAREMRGKTLGIVGYGHIGTQVSILAEALGMRVVFFDVVRKLALGNAEAVPSLEALLAQVDVVSLHVPDTSATRGMIGRREIEMMRPGTFLINASRGKVVELDSLAEALRNERLAGAAIDVFPVEPKTADQPLTTPLQGLPNVILTPHIGGSTLEAQQNIGAEVADKLIHYSDTGSTIGAVNFPEVALPVQHEVTRFLHIHRNVPGVLARINQVFSARGLNISGQYLRTDPEVGYVVSDIAADLEEGMGVRKDLAEIEGTLRVRFLY